MTEIIRKNSSQFSSGKQMVLLTDINKNQYARFDDDHGFATSYLVKYRQGQNKIPDGLYPSDLFELPPPLMVNFAEEDGSIPKTVNEKIIYLKKEKIVEFSKNILTYLIGKRFTVLLRDESSTDLRIIWKPETISIEECRSLNKELFPERNCVSLQECFEEEFRPGGYIILPG